MNEQEIRRDLQQISSMKPPVKRAAYSDRTAWLMAALSDVAYKQFDIEDKNALLALAGELATLTSAGDIVAKLENFRKVLDSQENKSDNASLRAILQAGDFELKGVLFDRATDTQGFVAIRRLSGERGMAVISFRGTEKIRDWITNFQADKVAVLSDESDKAKVLGEVHRGFNTAFKSVEDKIREYLKDANDLPLYITGHSLGGALATLATWYLRELEPAACYTFGAPRVGDSGLQRYYRTPIYRIVNGADPVPFVPSDTIIMIVKAILRFAGIFVKGLDKAAEHLTKYQGFQHYGFQRYLSICAEKGGTYPNLRNEYGVSSAERLWRYIRRWWHGDVFLKKRIDKYHNMSAYRAKLRAYAIRRKLRI